MSQPAGHRLTLSLPLSKLHTATVLCALNARRGWGWGATFDVTRSEDDGYGVGSSASLGRGPGSPRSQRSRGGRKRAPSAGTRIGLGRPLRVSWHQPLGLFGGAEDAVADAWAQIQRETIALPPIETHELGEVGKEVRLERVTTGEAEAWEKEEAERDLKGIAV